MAKDQFLVIRFERENLERLKEVAEEDHLAPTTWARQQLLIAVERAEKEQKE